MNREQDCSEYPDLIMDNIDKLSPVEIFNLLGFSPDFDLTQITSEEIQKVTIEAMKLGPEVASRVIAGLVQFASEIAGIDILTGLTNQRAFRSALAVRMNATRSYPKTHKSAVVFGDMDGFKNFNDEFGHENGSRILIEFANRLRKTFQRGTDVISRFGGDEFVLMLSYDEGKDFDENQLKEAIRKTLEDLVFEKDGRVYPIGISLGIVRLDGDSLSEFSTATDLIAEADRRMYIDKEEKEKRLAAVRERVENSKVVYIPKSGRLMIFNTDPVRACIQAAGSVRHDGSVLAIAL